MISNCIPEFPYSIDLENLLFLCRGDMPIETVGSVLSTQHCIEWYGWKAHSAIETVEMRRFLNATVLYPSRVLQGLFEPSAEVF